MQLQDRIEALPNELAHLIITHLVDLHNNDPVYQWTHLRCITRLHRAQVERHFYDFWLPRLSVIHAHYNGGFQFKMAPDQPDQRSEKDIAKFQMQRQDIPGTGGRSITQADISNQLSLLEFHNRCRSRMAHYERDHRPFQYIQGEELPMVIRMGEGIMNRGYSGGGIITDMQLPELTFNASNVKFNWRLLFTNWFAEELLMQRMRDELLRATPPLEITLGTSQTDRKSTHQILRRWYQSQRREMIEAFRVRKAARPRNFKFNIAPFLYAPASPMTPKEPIRSFSLLPFVHEEESMIFAVTNWEMWSEEELINIRLAEVGQELEAFKQEMSPERRGPHRPAEWLSRLEGRQKLLQKAQKGEEDAGEMLRLCWKHVGTGEVELD
ncbi:hypothetical protein NX059_002200 [Plenodomus lindquistii]|nr:hypothetical protein NX059_002200 [Plenodomus lindquistii]